MNKILFLVDDNRTVRMFYHERLSRQGLEVLTSSDTEGLFEKVDSHKPDIIVMDTKRWEKLRGYPAFQYDLKSTVHGYHVARAHGSNGLRVRVELAEEDNEEFLELILRKENRRNKFNPLRAFGEKSASPVRLPVRTEWRNRNWALA
jgi:DNA-binding NtrC family response regulator